MSNDLESIMNMAEKSFTLYRKTLSKVKPIENTIAFVDIDYDEEHRLEEEQAKADIDYEN